MSASAGLGEDTAEVPSNLRNLRACRHCKLLKSYDQFMDSFCDNCDWKPSDGEGAATARRDLVERETTPQFTGLVALTVPKGSWVARWLRMRGPDEKPYKRGLYAIAIVADDDIDGDAGEYEDEDDEGYEEDEGVEGEGEDEEEGDSGFIVKSADDEADHVFGGAGEDE